jgi:hypothetical protein
MTVATLHQAGDSTLSQRTDPGSVTFLRLAVFSILGCIALRLCLDYSYFAIVRVLFKEVTTLTQGVLPMIESYAWTVVAGLCVALSVHRRLGIASTVEMLYLAFVILPALTLLSAGGLGVPGAFVRMLVVSFAVLVFVRVGLPELRLPIPGRLARLIGFALAVGIGAYVYAGLIGTGGLGRINFDLRSVYLVREELEETSFPFSGYLISWQAHVINMTFLAIAIWRRRIFVALLIIAAQLLLFGMTNYKSFLFAPVLVVGFFFLTGSRLRLVSGIFFGAVAGILLAQLLYAITDEIMIPSIFVRRLFFTPAELHFWYYQYFSQPDHPHVLLSNSVLSMLSSYPYATPPTSLVSWEFMGVEAGANVGWLADAYMHFGFAGMLAFAVLFAFVLKVVDAASGRVPLAVACGAVAVPAMAIMNSGLFTALLTHGLLVGTLSLWLAGSMLARERSAAPATT